GKIYGGAVSAPVFKEIADKIYATRLNIHDETKDKPAETSVLALTGVPLFHEDAANLYEALELPFHNTSTGAIWLNAKADSLGLALRSINYRENLIPNLKGMNARDAVFLLENMGMKVQLSGHGQVAWQSVNAGSTPVKGQKIELKLLNL
ncbi:MAG: PASTA domain-containing protein, partial [Bacteroidales bacterium]|nr:PASTA domain-containing protein [Bacteroidales bacterium]